MLNSVHASGVVWFMFCHQMLFYVFFFLINRTSNAFSLKKKKNQRIERRQQKSSCKTLSLKPFQTLRTPLYITPTPLPTPCNTSLLCPYGFLSGLYKLSRNWINSLKTENVDLSTHQILTIHGFCICEFAWS